MTLDCDRMHSLQAALLVAGAMAFGLFLAGWVAYPVVLYLLRPRRASEPQGSEAAELPSVDVIIATREPAAAILARVRDVLDADYPLDRLHVIVGLDAASLASLSDVEAALGSCPGTTVVRGDQPGGKAAALNAAVRAAKADVVVFTDTAQRFAPSAISRLVGCILRHQVGGASGYLRAKGDRGALGRFWNYETLVRKLESDLDSLVGVTGAVYAVRREAWQPLREGLINDDVAVPLLARRAGFRVLHCPEAEAYDDRSFERTQQFNRRVRTLTGVYQILAWYPWVASPWANPLWAQFFLHKVVRLATPYLLGVTGLAVLAIGGGALLAGGTLVAAFGLLVLSALEKKPVGTIAAELGWILRLLLLAPLAASRNALRGDWSVWGTGRSPVPGRSPDE